MSNQIACPECGHSFSLRAPKPGKYKPACSACKKSFVLVAHAGEPVRLEVLRLGGPGNLQSGVPVSPPPKKPATATVDDPDRKPAGPPPVSRETATGGSLDATMDSGAGKGAPSAGSRTKAAASISAPAPETGQTLEAGPSQTQKPAVAESGSGSEPLPARMGGYRILAELGRGGMGAVYLANQVSLDRNVALKTIRGSWTASPRAVARFIREAYAAAQLTHHNVVQIYDLGEDRGTNFFSMELVDGGSLQDLLKKEQRIAPIAAANMIAQAARGLKFAHDHGMVHRDIKPANLMLTSDGMVKVADLGLVKTPTQVDDEPVLSGEVNPALSTARSSVTDAGTAMGTPAYMSPEQSDDATRVDHRADIYSLGCTFYALLTGHAPFRASTAAEMKQLHKQMPMPPARAENPDVPEALDRIIQRMTAKTPAQRYPSVDEVIADIEKALATGEKRDQLTKEQNIGRLNAVLKAFNSAPLLPLRNSAPLLLGGLALVLLAILVFAGQFRAASAVAFAAFVFPLVSSLVSGFFQGASPVGSRVRAFLLGSSWSEWLMWGLGLLLVVASVAALGLGLWWLGGLAVSTGIAFALYFGLTRAIGLQRRPALEQAQKLLRSFRASGIDEPSIRGFVAEFSGRDWEEFFEALFDYDTLRAARASLVEGGKAVGRRKYAAWRDPVIDRIDEKIRQRKAERERRLLARVEHAGMKAGGMSEQEARQKSLANAASMVDAACSIREAGPSGESSIDAAKAKRERIKAMLLEARSGPRPDPKSLGARAKEAALDHLFGAKFRFLVAAGLIAACVFWARQNGFLDPLKLEALRAQAESLGHSVQTGGVQSIAGLRFGPLTDDHPALNVPLIGQLFKSAAPVLVALVVLVSAFATGWKYSLVVIPGVLIALLGPLFWTSFGLPDFGIAQSAAWISSLAGSALIVAGGLFLRGR